MRLEGKTAIVTGGARGMGAAEARRFAQEGARVVIADMRADEGAALADELGPGCFFAHLDVSNENAWRAVVRAALGRFGRLDVLINNAGIHWSRPIREELASEFDRSLSVNLLGAFLGIRAVIDPMRECGGGSIVNIASTAAFRGVVDMSAYTAGKWGMRGLSRVAATELAPHGIRVNCVCPGAVDTPMNPVFGTEAAAAEYPRALLRRLARPEEIAAAVLFLASDDASYVTGIDLVVDGGALLVTDPMP